MPFSEITKIKLTKSTPIVKVGGGLCTLFVYNKYFLLPSSFYFTMEAHNSTEARSETLQIDFTKVHIQFSIRYISVKHLEIK